MIVAAVEPALQIHCLVLNPQLGKGIHHLSRLVKGGHGGEAHVLLAQEIFRHLHAGEYVVIELDIPVFLFFLEDTLVDQALTHVGRDAHITPVVFIQEGVAHRQIVVVGLGLHDGQAGFIAGGAEHFQGLAAPDNKGGVDIIVVVDVAGDACGDGGKRSAVLNGCQDGGVFLAQSEQAHGNIV